jgi:hypothetical protein
MDLSDTLDALTRAAQDVVADARRWRPGFDHASVAVSVEPEAFRRSAMGRNRYHLEAEMVLTVNVADARSQQVRSHQVALELEKELGRFDWADVDSIESVQVRETRFESPEEEAVGGAVLTLDVEVVWT